MTREINGGGAAELWRRARAGWLEAGAAGPGPDAMDLAAYLDGALDEAERARVEAWLAGAPEGVELVLAARAALDAPQEPVPEASVRRAQAIVARRPAGRGGSAARRARLYEALGGLVRPAAWAGVAAALLLASASGFELGRTGVQHLAALDAAVAEDVALLTGRTSEGLL